MTNYQVIVTRDTFSGFKPRKEGFKGFKKRFKEDSTIKKSFTTPQKANKYANTVKKQKGVVQVSVDSRVKRDLKKKSR